MKGDVPSTGRRLLPGRAMLLMLAVTPLLATAVVIAGIGLVALLGQRGDEVTWSRWSSIGEAFGVVNSVTSALAVLALVITWLLQSRDLREQRMSFAHALEVEARKMHVTLIRMAVDHPHLGDVWPGTSGMDAARRSKYMYANLIVQHIWTLHTTNLISREEMISNLRYQFASPQMRDFWRDTANSRHSIYVEDQPENELTAIIDRICGYYEAMIDFSAGSVKRQESTREWAAEDRQGGGWADGVMANPSPPPAESLE
jgi:uncharacterized protein DUF6082